MQLRTDELITNFINSDAVKLPSARASSSLLTMDQVLIEIEKDEHYESSQLPTNAEGINHKEFITWKEFISYFTDYKVISERN
jgi:hypothetical protein